MKLTIKLHTGLQYLIIAPDNSVLDSVAFNIYDHAYRLADSTPIRCPKHKLLESIQAIYPNARLVEARIKGQVAIALHVKTPPKIEREKSYSYAIADASRTE